MEIPLKLNNTPLDYELSELLGEKPADFIVICADGEPVPFAGTPYDSIYARDLQQRVVNGLNDRSAKSWWPDFFENHKRQFCAHYKLPMETTANDWHPTFSLEISRTCVGYSKHIGPAIVLFDLLGDRVKSWSVGKSQTAGEGKSLVESVEIIAQDGRVYSEVGAGITPLSQLIALAVVRLLRDQPTNP